MSLSAVYGGGLNFKLSCKVASIGNISNLASASVVIDGATLVAGDRVLVKDQTTQSQNGIYVVGTVATALAAFTRPDDASSENLIRDAIVLVSDGAKFGGHLFKLNAITGAITIGSTNLAFTDISGGDGDMWKLPVKAATAASLAAYTRSSNIITADASGALGTIDGITLAAGDRMLLKNGAAGADNGLYEVTVLGDGSTAYKLTRVFDANTSAKYQTGMAVMVQQGTANGGALFYLSTTGAITLNTTSQTWTRYGNSSIDLSAGTLIVPTSASPAQTTEASLVWDSDDDLLTVGTGASRTTLVDTTATQTLAAKSLSAPKVIGSTPAAAADSASLGVSDANGALTAALDIIYEGGGRELRRVMSTSATLKHLDWAVTLADDASQALLAPGTRGKVRVSESGGVEYGTALIAPDGTVTIQAGGSANFVNTDTDAKLCVYNNSGTPTVRNRLGGSRDVFIEWKSY